MKLIIATVGAALTLTACAPAPTPICNREAQEWNKFDTVEDTCLIPVTLAPVLREHDDDDPYTDPDLPETPDDTPQDRPDDTPDRPTDRKPDRPDRVKGNNGWGNGDDAAPGRSRDRNNAENGERTQRNHGPANRN